MTTYLESTECVLRRKAAISGTILRFYQRGQDERDKWSYEDHHLVSGCLQFAHTLMLDTLFQTISKGDNKECCPVTRYVTVSALSYLDRTLGFRVRWHSFVARSKWAHLHLYFLLGQSLVYDFSCMPDCHHILGTAARTVSFESLFLTGQVWMSLLCC